MALAAYRTVVDSLITLRFPTNPSKIGRIGKISHDGSCLSTPSQEDPAFSSDPRNAALRRLRRAERQRLLNVGGGEQLFRRADNLVGVLRQRHVRVEVLHVVEEQLPGGLRRREELTTLLGHPHVTRRQWGHPHLCRAKGRDHLLGMPQRKATRSHCC